MSTLSMVRPAHAFNGAELAEHTLERRAVEAAIWGMPMVSVDAMRQAFFRDAGAKYNDIVYLSHPADWRFQITTPNASSRYVYIPINLKKGPVVLEVPAAVGAGLVGNINDAWQKPEADVGPTGEDGGKGGKYLIVPPDHIEAIPHGYIPVRFSTYNGYSFLRVIPDGSSAVEVGKALDVVKKTRIYSLAQAPHPPSQHFVDIAGKIFDGVARFDDTFYDSLARMVDEEPVQPHDFVAMNQLRSIGIEKGKPFKPDASSRKVLKKAILEARAGFMQGTMDLPSFWAGTQWGIPTTSVAEETGFTFEKDACLYIDARAQLFFLGCAPAKKPGLAAFYLGATKDATGAPLQGGRTYRLRVPPKVPAKQFWAVTVYDLETAAFVRDAPHVEVNSYNEKVQKNADGSLDVFFGPVAPATRDANWVTTSPGKPWMAMFRLYGPKKGLLERTWELPDIEKMK